MVPNIVADFVYDIGYDIGYDKSNLTSSLAESMQMDIINNEICTAKRGNLHDKPLIDDPMKSIVLAHVSMLE